MNDREYRRERVLDQAIASGKFPESRRQHYRESWDRDAAGTEQVISSLEGVPILASMGHVGTAAPAPGSLEEQVSLGRSLYPELGGSRPLRHGGTSAPVPAPAQPAPPPAASVGGNVVELRPETVSGWTEQLYPEVAARKAVPQTDQRIFNCND